jgi:hypothetical protein
LERGCPYCFPDGGDVLGDEGVVAETGLGGVGSVVERGYFGGVGVVLYTLGLNVLAT